MKKNLIVAVFSQIFTIIFALIVPKLLINYYGPQIHGLTATIASLISYLTLVEAGLGAASVQGLYAPLKKRDQNEVNACLNAIAIFYRRIGMLFFAFVTIIAFIYPLISADNLNYWLVFTLILISGLANTVEFFFTNKYRVLLQADRKIYVVNLANAIGIFLQGCLRILFIELKFNIYIVQLIPSIVYIIRLLIVSAYVKRRYTFLDETVPPDYSVGNKRWNALIHQISNLIVNNTDNIVLSSFVGYTAVSIYGVYHMVISNIGGFLSHALSNAITANFGHLLISSDKSEIHKLYDIYERAYYYLIGFIFGICSFSLSPFVDLYIGDVHGVQYADSTLGVLFVMVAVLSYLRIPQLTMVTAAGHFKETQNHAITEALINIVLSVLLVSYIGIYGVLIGTIVSFIYRDIMFVFHVNKRILYRPIKKTILNLGILLAVFFLTSGIGKTCGMFIHISSWLNWIIICSISGVISLAMMSGFVVLFDKPIVAVIAGMLKK